MTNDKRDTAVRSINPDGLAVPDGPFTQVIVANGFVFVSGQTALDEDGQLGDAQAAADQTRRTIENLRRALEAANSDLQHVVKLVWYLTDIEDRADIAAVRHAIWSPPYPTSTLVEISRLALPELRLEVDAIAIAHDEASQQ